MTIDTRTSLKNLEHKAPLPPNGFATNIQIPVRSRGLGGLLEPFDKLEDGTRVLDAEWDIEQEVYEDTFGEGAKGSSKVLLYFHGGAYCYLSKDMHRPLVLRTAGQLGVPALCKLSQTSGCSQARH